MINIKGYKLVWFENVFGWIMTGIVGPDCKWFLGYSINRFQSHDISLIKEAAIKGRSHPTHDNIVKTQFGTDNDLIPLEIDWVLGKCPVCGAESDQQCSIDDPDREGFAIELSGWIHRERNGYWHE